MNNRDVRAKPRFGWIVRPVSFVVGVVAGLLTFLTVVGGRDLVGALPFLIVTSIAVVVFKRAWSAERQWNVDASAAAIDAERRWQAKLATSAASSGPLETEPLSMKESQFLEEARRVRDEQLGDLVSDGSFWFKGSRGGFGASVELENMLRARRARDRAIAAARASIAGHGELAHYTNLLRQVQRALGDRMDWLVATADGVDANVARSAVEWATLALVSEPWISDAEYGALYGPWWRAVGPGRAPAWVARWSTLSLAGVWLTIAGVICAASLNQGVVAYVSLGILAVGVTSLVVGTIWGATHSEPWPVPARSASVGTGDRSAAFERLHRIWRSPEAVSQWFVRRRS